MEYLSINAVNLRSESFLRTANWPPDKFDIFKELKKRLRYSIVYKEARQNIFIIHFDILIITSNVICYYNQSLLKPLIDGTLYAL